MTDENKSDNKPGRSGGIVDLPPGKIEPAPVSFTTAPPGQCVEFGPAKTRRECMSDRGIHPHRLAMDIARGAAAALDQTRPTLTVAAAIEEVVYFRFAGLAATGTIDADAAAHDCVAVLREMVQNVARRRAVEARAGELRGVAATVTRAVLAAINVEPRGGVEDLATQAALAALEDLDERRSA